ncbi:hypothetical protein IFT54_05650 [Sphingomonas sp. CFBP 13714]|uniref:hypothetical protein n=1 Tax=Sphingomonas sp. CFBP 13714 TaxID=2775308 RepID=UPI00178382AF|nr:hypothetical protein [Sphingomonas sp. CFBP 13714]MBD8699299.1 hypothetical protein [Sphingomonas sp. CFBP 13714]
MRYLVIASLVVLTACKEKAKEPEHGSPAWAKQKAEAQGKWADKAAVAGNNQAPLP